MKLIYVMTRVILHIKIGEAALYILREEFGENWPEKVKVIFAGDDTTDEDAMKVNLLLQSKVEKIFFNHKLLSYVVGIERSWFIIPCFFTTRNRNIRRLPCAINKNNITNFAMASRYNESSSVNESYFLEKEKQFIFSP